jgi:uncharacterized membrane protein
MYVSNRGKLRQRRGATLLLACASFAGIVFLFALAIDGGLMMAERRHAQNCCDAAALAGCVQLAALQAKGLTPSLVGIQQAAETSATNNNYTNGSNCTITVNWPPTSGNFQTA